MQYPNALALRVSLETGLRIDDVLSLRSTALRKCKIFGIAKKTGKSFKKTISRDLARRLGELMGKYYIFPGRLDPQKHRTRQAVWKDVKKACAILEIDGNIAPHSARKTYAVEKFRDSGLGTVKRELQHKDVSTTMLYAFADYLDYFPTEATKKLGEDEISRTNVRKMEGSPGGSRYSEPQGVPLDGAFWETFAGLVADKVVAILLEKIRPSG